MNRELGERRQPDLLVQLRSVRPGSQRESLRNLRLTVQHRADPLRETQHLG